MYLGYLGPSVYEPRRDKTSDMTEPTKRLCAQRRLRSAWAFRTKQKQIFFSKLHICSKCILLDLYVRVFLEPNIHGYIVYMFVYTCILDIWVRVYMSRDVTKPATWQNQQKGCAPSEDSDQPGHPPSLIRVFAVRMKKHWVLSYALSTQRRLWSDWADAQADLSHRWAHTHFVGFVMSWLICTY